ncbi:hypothetical protein D3C85_1296480 [compost metagenome]
MVTALDPDAVLLDQLLGVDLGEELQLSGDWLRKALDGFNCPVQCRAGQFLGADADHAVHRVRLWKSVQRTITV